MDWKKIGKHLLFPPIWIMSMLTIISTASLILIFVNKMSASPIAYVAYMVSFYSLVIICAFFWKVFPNRYREIKQKIYDHPVGNRYITDVAFRTHMSLYAALGVNLLYVGVNILSFFLYHSMWFIVLGIYYIILSIMRFLLVRYVRVVGIGQNRTEELKRTILCSSILLTLNFVLTGAVLMILYQDKGFNYHGILIYVMAAYSFYITTQAVINLVKYRKYKSPVITTTNVIALSAALVSMLSLETAMFSQFGQDMNPDDKWLMIALTGAGVSLIVLTMSIYMIIRSTKEINKIRSTSNEE